MKCTQWLLLLLAVRTFGAVDSTEKCRCLSFQKCWPSASEFSLLAAQLSQPLIKPTPPAAACYPYSKSSDNCSDVLDYLYDAGWRSDLPGAMQALNFESYTFSNGTINACYYNTSLDLPCEQGNIPTLGVDARSVGDIQATVKFAKRHNLRLVIKNTGAGRGGFMLWTHNLKNITYDAHFVPRGATAGQIYQAMTFGAGVQWNEAYSAANDNGRFILGGISPGGSLGASGGWILGGGHSAFSPKYGLGIDNVIQFTVVLASGKYVTANAYKNADLFWALRGGGGGTYGVVVTTTYRTFEILPLTVARLDVNFSSPQIAQEVVPEYLKIHPSLSDDGWGGYSRWSNKSLTFTYFGANVSLLDANATMIPFFNHAKALVKNPQDIRLEMGALDSFYELYALAFDIPSGAGGLLELFSRLMSRSMVKEYPEKVARMTLAVDGLSFRCRFSSRPHATGINPAWRDALGVLIVVASWGEGTSATEISHLRQNALVQLNDYLDKVSPDSGTYFNEGSLYEKDPRKTFFGEHYTRLKAIKRKYDADDLFLVAEGVGSDDWGKSLNCRLR
ncbi:hypothetical protein M378DRAFT_15105 [Amanita muscaria Koide BX008]|uniref:FAD-binding PCMH-type domain-containing protein n=1 Tax=Amanita muscaria (strain Koide BX008) TaxID=946122 RepID=A0A0C2WQT6_AMAMK|nr:hypothetical protein M378DRAFT_15105 [Amanita muscaria Koide BX008]